jgi:hypothetical protein
MLQVTYGIGVNLLINLVAQNLRDSVIHAEPGRCEMVDLHCPDLIVSKWSHPISCRCCTTYWGGNLLGSEFAEYLLYYVTTPKAVPDAVQGESFQRGNIILENNQSNFHQLEEDDRNLIRESID